MNSEHIIPLSLGGSNQFVIPVDAEFNSRIGSSIDGKLASDFLMMFRRCECDARGHSNKEPAVVAKRSRFEHDGSPVQVEFHSDKSMQVWDPIKRCHLSEEAIAGRTISSQFKMDRYARLKFAAKVALAGGYFIYGELFRKCVCHSDLRALVQFQSDSPRGLLSGVHTRVYDEFVPAEPGDEQEMAMQRFFCEFVGGSCLIAIPGPGNVGFVVGILGRYLATLNVPATTDDFPVDDDHDLGHAVVLSDGGLRRLSYRALAFEAAGFLDQVRKEETNVGDS